MNFTTTIILDIKCPFCKRRHTVLVDELEYHAYLDGMSAVKAFPHLSATEREQIISHLCPTCIQKTFKEM